MKKYLAIVPIIFIASYFLLSPQLSNLNNLKVFNLISNDQKTLIYKYFFPYKYIKALQNKINTTNLLPEMNTIDRAEYIRFEGPKKFKIFDQITELNLLTNFGNLTAGIENNTPGSAYLDFNNEQLFLISSRGLVAYSDNFDVDETVKFKVVSNNIRTFINEKQFSKNKWYSIKDLTIIDDSIYISYTKELKPDCWNTSVLVSKIDLKNLEFKELFSPDYCIKKKNEENSFNAHQSGGRIVNYDNKNIILSIGEYRSRYKAQEDDNVFGKIILINKSSGKYKIISKGHRNPQGLLYDKKNDFIVSSEHGPSGGDEINLNLNPSSKISNYGWPISSYGEHYPGEIKKNSKVYEKYPLNKSHSDFGFVEPLHYFVPSIGISEIIQFTKNKFIVSSMREKSIYTFEINNNYELENLKKIYVGERIRDMIYNENQKMLLMFLENTASIGVLKF